MNRNSGGLNPGRDRCELKHADISFYVLYILYLVQRIGIVCSSDSGIRVAAAMVDKCKRYGSAAPPTRSRIQKRGGGRCNICCRFVFL
jgi:hypothetical protein